MISMGNLRLSDVKDGDKFTHAQLQYNLSALLTAGGEKSSDVIMVLFTNLTH